MNQGTTSLEEESNHAKKHQHLTQNTSIKYKLIIELDAEMWMGKATAGPHYQSSPRGGFLIDSDTFVLELS